MTISRRIALVGIFTTILLLPIFQPVWALNQENDYPVAKETWGDHLLGDNDSIPTESFLAIYFRSSHPDYYVYKEVVPKISINYAWDEFHNINSKEFSAYWVGDFEFETAEVRELHLSQSWAKTRIIVDRKIIYDGGGSKVIPVNFTPGKHRIEVQYVNNWHTVGFSLKFLARQTTQSPPPEPDEKSNIWFVGVYESSDRMGQIVLNLKREKDPVYLCLSSYETVTWKIDNPHDTPVAGVYYSSYKPGTEIEMADASVPRIQVSSRQLPYIFTLEPKCNSIGGYTHCDPPLFQGDKLKSAIKFLADELFPTGFSGKYSASALKVPEKYLGLDDYDRMHAESKALDSSLKKQKKAGSFDEMFKR